MSDNASPVNRALDTRLDRHGRESAAAQLASPGSTDDMFVKPSQAIPIVFVPGIMGSPLISNGGQTLFDGQGKWAWFPDGQSWMLRGYGGLSAAERKDLLDPSKARALVSPGDADREVVANNLESTTITVDEALRRGWGSVMISSYGKILEYLETQMNFIYFRASVYPGTQAALPSDPNRWGRLRGYERLTDAQLKKAAKWRYPVYAVGYNWLDTNSRAADFLKERIDAIRADCRGRLKLRCDKVILVTHSMGGLVARMCAKRNPNDVLGVVHGVQPAVGAATAYSRVRSGWESNGSLLHPLNSIVGMVGAWVLGPTGAEVSAVFANAAGPLELLPNHLYGAGWLRVTAEDGNEELFSMPRADPYEEIYRVPDKWWRLIHPGMLLRPSEAGNQARLNAAWMKFSATLDKAKSFHTTLGDYYHPNTFAHCGADRGQMAWHRAGWRLQPLVDIASGIRAKVRPAASAVRDTYRLAGDRMNGTCTINDVQGAGDVWVSRNGVGVVRKYGGDVYRAWILDKDDEGDATVPAHSGRAPRASSKFFAEMRGFEHQGSYANSGVQAVTHYSLLRIGSEVADLS
jgi:pimeloyl-ACP methyl ester carboxylesterase